MVEQPERLWERLAEESRQASRQVTHPRREDVIKVVFRSAYSAVGWITVAFPNISILKSEPTVIDEDKQGGTAGALLCSRPSRWDEGFFVCGKTPLIWI